MFPRSDILIPLYDAGYSLRVDESDGSTTLGRVGLEQPFNVPTGTGGYGGANLAEAFFPQYNSESDPLAETPTSYALTPTSNTQFTNTGAIPANSVFAFYEGFPGSGALCQIVYGADGFGNFTVSYKITAWPGTIDYTTAGMSAVTIAVPMPFAVGGMYAAIFLPGLVQGFVIWGINTSSGLNYLLPIGPTGTNSAFALDLGATILPGGAPTVSYPSFTTNFQIDLSSPPTVNVYIATFDLSTSPMTCGFTLSVTGDVSADAANALAISKSNQPTYSYTQNFLFGIDWWSGNDTGCWYCNYDGSAFGRVLFTMPDLSIGPSSSPQVFWTQNMVGSNQTWWYYPQFDIAGNVLWIRVPLVDAFGNMVIEPLTGEVYGSASPPPASIPPVILDQQALPHYTLPFTMTCKRCFTYEG